MTSAELLARLQKRYPLLGFEVMESPEDQGLPDGAICFDFDETCMIDATRSVCMRFEVDPNSTYGIDAEDAALLRENNFPEAAPC